MIHMFLLREPMRNRTFRNFERSTLDRPFHLSTWQETQGGTHEVTKISTMKLATNSIDGMQFDFWIRTKNAAGEYIDIWLVY